MEERIAQLERTVANLSQTIAGLVNGAEMSDETQNIIVARIVQNSNKNGADSNVSVVLNASPGGVVVMIPPAGFIKLQNGRNIPYYLDQ